MLGGTRAAQLGGETARQFVFAQQGEQLLQVQLLGLADPAKGLEWLQGEFGVAYFLIDEAVAAKQFALAHHHAHHQGLGWRAQLAEGMDERQFLFIEQVLVALFDPQQYLAEVVQVIERVVDGVGNHGLGQVAGTRHWLYIQTQGPGKCRGSARPCKNGRQRTLGHAVPYDSAGNRRTRLRRSSRAWARRCTACCRSPGQSPSHISARCCR